MTKAEFANRKWGVFCHYLDSLQNGDGPHNTRGRKTQWQECVEDLDAEKLAGQVSELGAGYFFLTMQQGTRHFIAPSESFEDLTGLRDGCARRDLVLDLYEALKKRGIDLFLYYTGDGMPRDSDERLARRFGWQGGDIPESLVREWSGPLAEYSRRYGDKVKGWWLDGVYKAIGYNVEKLKILRDAARSGNPEALVSNNFYGCFVIGTERSVRIGDGDVLLADFYQSIADPTPLCDFTAGELVCFNAYPAPDRTWDAVPHAFSFLGIPPKPWEVYNGWGAGGCKYSAEYMAAYIGAVNRLGGAVTVDMRLYRDGSLEPAQRETMAKAAALMSR